MKLFNNKVFVSWFFALFLSYSAVGEANELAAYAGSSLEYINDLGSSELDVILSAPKRINNTLEIEKSELVAGKVRTRLFELKGSAQLSEVFSYYRDAMSQEGDIQYQCEKRACGSSNYWANKIFDEHKLYGRDSSQYYLVGLSSDKGLETWTAIYIVQNGLRKKYVYELSVVRAKSGDQVSGGAGVWVNGLAIGENEFTKKHAALMQGYIESTGATELFVVVYSDKAIKPTGVYWGQLQTKVDILEKQVASVIGEGALSVQHKLLGPLHENMSPAKSPVWFKLYLF